jgi:hypothetical protein
LLDHESQEFPVFQNLTTLVLRCCDIGAFNSQVLLRILDSTPNLEKIGLYHCKVYVLQSLAPVTTPFPNSTKPNRYYLDPYQNLNPKLSISTYRYTVVAR